MSALLQAAFLVAALALITPSLAASPGTAPTLLFSDLDSGPNTGGQDNQGVFVTIWGNNFGGKRGEGYISIGGGRAAKYVSWSDDKIVFQLGEKAATGNIAVTTANGAHSNGLPFTVRSGRIFFIDAKVKRGGSGTFDDPWGSPTSFYDRIKPGDTAYFRGGTYTGNWGGNWGDRNLALGTSKGGTAGKPVAFVGYPGESAVLKAPEGYHGNFVLTDTTRTVAHYVTVANLVMQGAGDCFGGGGFWQNEKSGGTHVRVIGNHFSARYTGNTMTGLLVATGDHWRIFGNEFADTGTTPPINNNHAVYIQTGASDVDVGWNRFRNLRMGHVIQVHTDVAFRYENIRIHDNLITAKDPSDSRGINVGRAQPGTYGAIYNNVLYNVGQNFSAIALYYGDWKVYNNTFYNIRASGGMVWLSGQYGGTPTAVVTNNIFYSDGNSAYLTTINGAKPNQLTADTNLYFGYHGKTPSAADKNPIKRDPLFKDAGNGDFHLKPGSPAIDSGSNDVAAVVKYDYDGTARPHGKRVDIGAFETTSR